MLAAALKCQRRSISESENLASASGGCRRRKRESGENIGVAGSGGDNQPVMSRWRLASAASMAACEIMAVSAWQYHGE